MVNRDDLPDGGAPIMAATVKAIRQALPDCTTELLSSDMMGNWDNLKTMLDSEPSIMSHNLETVRRLTPVIRSRSDYDRSLAFLQQSLVLAPQIPTKSSIMLGLGETKDEVIVAIKDIRATGVTLINLGQYLQPTKNHAPVQKFWTPDEFAELKTIALDQGFHHVESAPLVQRGGDWRISSGFLTHKAPTMALIELESKTVFCLFFL